MRTCLYAATRRSRTVSMTDSCTMSLRVEVQRWPQVPMAPNTAARRAMSRLALGVMITALLPPSSSRDLPRRAATVAATCLPMRVDPVADTRATRWSSATHFPTWVPPLITEEMPSGSSFSAKTSASSFWQARLQRGTFSLGFQTQTSPHTRARAVFQLQTATGKLKADMMPTMPSGWYCSYMRCSGRSECMVSPCN